MLSHNRAASITKSNKQRRRLVSSDIPETVLVLRKDCLEADTPPPTTGRHCYWCSLEFGKSPVCCLMITTVLVEDYLRCLQHMICSSMQRSNTTQALCLTLLEYRHYLRDTALHSAPCAMGIRVGLRSSSGRLQQSQHPLVLPEPVHY